MFYYTQNGGDMCISTNKGENECQNNLSQFYGKNFNSIIIDGNNKSEFVLRSYKSNIDKLDIRNCVINLDEAMGYFQYVTFYYCKFYGNLNDKFHAISFDFTGGLKLSSLSGGDIEIINIKCSTQQNNTINQVDFDGTEQMTNLNSLTLSYCYADLSKFIGTWKRVEFLNCGFRQQLTSAFQSDYMKIESDDKYALCAFTNYHFNHISFKFQYCIFNPMFQNQNKWKSIDLIFELCTIDLEQLHGQFNIFEAQWCHFQNSLTSQFCCDQIRFIQCGLDSNTYNKTVYSTNIIQQIKCNSVYIQGNAVVEHLPNAKELSLQNCKVALKNQIINLEKLTLVECELIKLSALQVPSLKELLYQNSSQKSHEIEKPLRYLIEMNSKSQRRNNKQVKDIEVKLKKRDRITKKINGLNCEIEFCIWLINNNYCLGYE
ncbi:Hypothetical_protein [Hexamita inflata]|uniref:Hypothetical_protein n=1 Tax=Hexamita inflata TaxID=28002 RepID=A0AA86R8T7_9EUKA|nr:Hypothetical protein HINF_LOCUS55734 [Hexamita inflata]